MVRRWGLWSGVFLILIGVVRAQSLDALPAEVDRGAAGLARWLHALKTRASLLMVTAHPDDEDGGMLALETRGADVYLGAIHSMPTLRERIEVARKFLPRFGLAAYCGFGRTPPDQLPQILDDHLAAVKIAGLA